MGPELRSYRVGHRYSLEKYLDEISQISLLSPEEEIELTRRIKQGEQDALHRLIRANLRFVVKVAKEYQNQGLPLTDLINEGNLGLIKAAKRFDETRGFKFISYAVWWIRQSILQAVGEKARGIRVPFNHQSNLMKVLRTRDDLTQILEREPTIEELALETGLTHDAVEKCLESNGQCSSLDAPVQEGEDTELSYFLEDSSTPLPDANVVHKESLQKEVQMLLNGLSDTEAQVLTMFYGIGKERTYGLEEISDYLGVGKERVRQIKYQGLKKLQSKIRQKGLLFSLN